MLPRATLEMLPCLNLIHRLQRRNRPYVEFVYRLRAPEAGMRSGSIQCELVSLVYSRQLTKILVCRVAG